MTGSLDRALRRLGNLGRSASSLRGCLDFPTDGARLSRSEPVVLWGWALDGFGQVAAVDVVLDGRRRIPARLGLARPDVPSTLGEPEASGLAGWTCEVDLSSFESAQVDIRVIARAQSGVKLILCDRAYVVRPDVPGVIETADHVAGSVLTVRGHALAEGTCPSTVEIEVDGMSIGRARLRLPLPHLAARPPCTAFAGFEHAVVLAAPGTTSHTIGAVVTGMRGSRLTLEERTVTVTVPRITDRQSAAASALRTKTAADVRIASRRALSPPPEGRFRILTFTHQLDLGGGQLYLQELLCRLAPALEAPTVVSPLDGELRAELEGLGMDVIVTGQAPTADLEAYEAHVRDVSMLVLETGCQAVLVNTLSGFAAVDAASRLEVPSVWAIHESFEVDHWLEMRFGTGGPHPYVTERMKASLGAASRLVFESEATSEMFAGWADAEHRSVVPYGVDIAGIGDYARAFDLAAARERHSIPRDATVLLCVGTVEERKAQATLVEAFAEVASAHPEAVLVLVGDRPGPYSAALHRLLDSLDLGDSVRLLPGTPEIWEWYALANVLVSGSDVESLPRSMLEAMAFGAPVLSAAVFGVPEVVRDGDTGWLFEPRDMRALTDAMHRVLDLPAGAREKAGQAARDLMEERHRSVDYGRAYAEIFRELTGMPNPAEGAASPGGSSSLADQ
jgi:D-inositol-3-phosphate glycosyltransferase